MNFFTYYFWRFETWLNNLWWLKKHAVRLFQCYIFIDNVKLVNILPLELQLRSHILNYTTPSNLRENLEWQFRCIYMKLSLLWTVIYKFDIWKWDFNSYVFVFLHKKIKGSLILQFSHPHFSWKVFFQRNFLPSVLFFHWLP